MTLDELAVLAPDIAVELHGVDLSFYMLFVVQGDSLLPVVDKQGKSVRFTSQYAARTALREAGFSRFEFVHRSAYGEMVGLDTSHGNTEMRLTVSL